METHHQYNIKKLRRAVNVWKFQGGEVLRNVMDSKDSQCMLIEHYEEKYVTNMCFAAHIL
jgi:hypothetical protein